jgi:SAM domain (Sterile alpha motif)
MKWRLGRKKRGPYNLEKFLLLGLQINELLIHQRHRYELELNPPLYNFLANVQPFDEEQLYKQSTKAEPLKGELARLVEEEAVSECISSSSCSSLESPSMDSLPDDPDSSSSQDGGPLDAWSVMQVRGWLTSDPMLAELLPALERFDGEQLCVLTDQRLVELGVRQLGLRKRLLARVNGQLRASPRSGVIQVSSSPVHHRPRLPLSGHVSSGRLSSTNRKLCGTGKHRVGAAARRSVSQDSHDVTHSRSSTSEAISPSVGLRPGRVSMTAFSLPSPACAESDCPSRNVRERLQQSDPQHPPLLPRPRTSSSTGPVCTRRRSISASRQRQCVTTGNHAAASLCSPLPSASPRIAAVNAVRFLSPRVCEWTTAEIAKWLRVIGQPHRAEHFCATLGSGTSLLQVTRDSLVELGVTKVGHRVQLLHAVAALRSLNDVPSDRALASILPPEPLQWGPEAVCTWIQSFNGLYVYSCVVW